MNEATCSDPQLADSYEAFVMGEGEVTVKLTDGSVHKLDYSNTDDYISGRMSEDDPMYAPCAALQSKFLEHKKTCAACEAKDLAKIRSMLSL